MTPTRIKAKLKKEADSGAKDSNYLLLHYFIRAEGFNTPYPQPRPQVEGSPLD